ncbi:MAG: TraR/DksA family transcriptional regulator [Bryobacteraceae bacterium]
MDRTQINELRTMISRRLKELSRSGMRNRDGIIIQKTPDTMDEVQFAAERDLAIRILDHDCVETRLVKAALARFEDGTYGLCLRCDKAIGWKRLRAVPHAAFCLACQEEVDRIGFDELDLDKELVGASSLD